MGQACCPLPGEIVPAADGAGSFEHGDAFVGGGDGGGDRAAGRDLPDRARKHLETGVRAPHGHPAPRVDRGKGRVGREDGAEALARGRAGALENHRKVCGMRF